MDIIIVDKDDNEIGIKNFDTVDYLKDIYRVSAAWVSNSQGEVLIAQRAFDKAHSPGCWGPSAAGTIEVGETYDQNIIHELEEEIGLTVTLADLTKGTKIFTHADNPNRRYFTQWYYTKADKPAEEFVIQKDEVEAVRWVAKEKLLAELTEKPKHFLDSFEEIINFIP